MSELSTDRGGSPGGLSTHVSCAGAIVGTARFERAEGLAHALFLPAPGYEMIAAAARAAGEWLSGTHAWPSDRGDFANALAAQWSAPPLALADDLGRDVPAASVIVVEPVHASGRRGGRWVIADFRADGARVPALRHTPDGSGRDVNVHPAA